MPSMRRPSCKNQDFSGRLSFEPCIFGKSLSSVCVIGLRWARNSVCGVVCAAHLVCRMSCDELAFTSLQNGLGLGSIVMMSEAKRTLNVKGSCAETRTPQASRVGAVVSELRLMPALCWRGHVNQRRGTHRSTKGARTRTLERERWTEVKGASTSTLRPRLRTYVVSASTSTSRA